MSEAPPDRTQEMLARLAELDLTAVEKAHRKLMVAEDASEITDLGRTYQRLARSLRQTLALKAKLATAQARDGALARIAQAGRHAASDTPAHDRRCWDLQDAVERIVTAAVDDIIDHQDLIERFDEEVSDWLEEPDFLTADLDAQVLRACRLLDLPEHLAPVWRTLPKPVYPPPAASPDPTSADAPLTPRHDTG